ASDFFYQQVQDGPSEFYTGLKFRHPASSWPLPSDEHEPMLFAADGSPLSWNEFDTTGLSVSGDGPCVPHAIKELSRAAYPRVFMGPEGQQVATVKGTIWPSLPQTSQAAEQMQLSLLPIFVP
ncbi:unnamed protein product, partial [Prorocentrum cordatum]